MNAAMPAPWRILKALAIGALAICAVGNGTARAAPDEFSDYIDRLLGEESARDAALTFNLVIEFSGGTAPSGPGPWLRATFTDVTGGVELKLECMLAGSDEGVKEWLFNLDPAFDPANLSFMQVSGSPMSGSYDAMADAFMADGDGSFDIRFSWPRNPLADRFNDGDMVVYMITSPDPISAASFNFLSTGAGGHGPFHTAAHIQGTGGDGKESGWIAEPEPATGLLLAAGGLPAILRRRRSR